MKKLAIAFVVVMFISAPAVADLCRKCRGKMYTMDVGKCEVCAGHTSSGSHKLCRTCSRRLGQCEHCRAPIRIKGAKPAAAVRPKRPTVNTKKSGTYTSGKWKYVYSIGAEVRHGDLAFDGKPIVGMKKFDRIDTPWGIMQFFGPRRKWGRGGWLLKTTYDGPIDRKKARLLPDPAKRRATLVAERTKALRNNVKNFSLYLFYRGEQGKPFYELTLSVGDVAVTAISPSHLYTTLSEKQALGIIDHLVADAFLARAEARLQRPPGKAPRGPCYLLRVSGGGRRSGVDLEEDLGWNLGMLKRLDALCAVLEGDAAKKMSLLLGRLSGHRRRWTADARKKPLK